MTYQVTTRAFDPTTVNAMDLTQADLATRAERWVVSSLQPNIKELDGRSYHILSLTQQVGRIEPRLIREDVRRSLLTNRERNTREELRIGYEHHVISTWWILAAFNLVWALNRGCTYNLRFKDFVKTIKPVKAQLAAIRAPLAKNEDGFEVNGSTIVPSGLHNGSTHWAIAGGQHVARIDASENLLLLLEKFGRYNSPGLRVHIKYPLA